MSPTFSHWRNIILRSNATTKAHNFISRKFDQRIGQEPYGFLLEVLRFSPSYTYLFHVELLITTCERARKEVFFEVLSTSGLVQSHDIGAKCGSTKWHLKINSRWTCLLCLFVDPIHLGIEQEVYHWAEAECWARSGIQAVRLSMNAVVVVDCWKWYLGPFIPEEISRSIIFLFLPTKYTVEDMCK